MPIHAQADIRLEKIAIAMDEILARQNQERAQAFASIHPILNQHLRDMEAEAFELPAPIAHVRNHFITTARIYLRALATYNAGTDAWMDVFVAFKRRFDKYREMMKQGA